MKICMIGAGYVGLISGACFAEAGNDVVIVDKDHSKIERLQQGILPIYEPHLEEIIADNRAEARLRFTTNLEEAIDNSLIIMIAVGTPEAADGSADLTYVKEAAASIGQHLQDYRIIVTKSTVPVGTGKLLERIVKNNLKVPIPFAYAASPEFLREGSGVCDHLHMDRAIIGTEDVYARYMLGKLYQPFTGNIVVTDDAATAEMIKYAANAFLATKITFINEIANICEKVGADVTQVAKGMGLDPRIGEAFLQAGVGFGGSCFPKDTKALARTAEEVGCPFRLLTEVIKVNEAQKLRVVEKVRRVHNSLNDKTIAVLGLTFKPNTDDTRSAPSHRVIKSLLEEGARVKAYDPVAERIAANVFGGAEISADLYATLNGCHGAVILTEWDEIKKMDLHRAKDCLQYPLLIDGRNLFAPQHLRSMGWDYYGIGRN